MAGAEADAFIADYQAEFPEPKPRPVTRRETDPRVKVARPAEVILKPAQQPERNITAADSGEAEICGPGASSDAGPAVEAAREDEREALVNDPPEPETPDPTSSMIEEEETLPDPEEDWDGPEF
ncbi:hypothetical protein [Paracoccus jeotgali]|uniref:hypothetical protein n=1 Tax=Paracoccus jeotgali TaxID=2065379 RepID=UPI0028AB1B56|nr:hypothetical protein [Paracoccus jeotgali]